MIRVATFRNPTTCGAGCTTFPSLLDRWSADLIDIDGRGFWVAMACAEDLLLCLSPPPLEGGRVLGEAAVGDLIEVDGDIYKIVRDGGPLDFALRAV